jgi:hypothetical protein
MECMTSSPPSEYGFVELEPIENRLEVFGVMDRFIVLRSLWLLASAVSPGVIADLRNVEPH